MNLRNQKTYIVLDAFTSPLFSLAMFLFFVSAGMLDHVETNTNQIWPVPAIFFLLILSALWNSLTHRISPAFTQYNVDNLIKIAITRAPLLILFAWFLPLEGNIIGFIYIPVTAILLIYAGMLHLIFYITYRKQLKLKHITS